MSCDTEQIGELTFTCYQFGDQWIAIGRTTTGWVTEGGLWANSKKELLTKLHKSTREIKTKHPSPLSLGIMDLTDDNDLLSLMQSY